MFGIGEAVAAGLKVIDKFIPDPQAKADAIFKLKTLEQQGDIAQLNAFVTEMTGQVEINKIEAASNNIFKSGWRPFIGWTCGSIFAYNYLLQPFFIFLVIIFNPEFDHTTLPNLDSGEVMPVLMGLLGLGSLRTFEKHKGVA